METENAFTAVPVVARVPRGSAGLIGYRPVLSSVKIGADRGGRSPSA